MAMGNAQRYLPVDGYRIGVKSRWLLGDLDQLVMRVRKRDRALNLPPGAPSRFRSAMHVVLPAFRARSVLRSGSSLSDPRTKSVRAVAIYLKLA
jgi:hypothetical protein